MSQKNNKPKRTFVPQKIGDTITKINSKYSSKFGKIEFLIHSNWSDIAGSYFAEYSEPKNISRIPDYENEIGDTIYKNHLNVSVTPSAALEFQHFKDKILEKINSYFGYKAIIDLRIKQNYIPTNKNTNRTKMKTIKITDTEKLSISNQVKGLDDTGLKTTLLTLGKNITEETK